MILVDSNVPMYLVGGPHPHKTDAQRLLERLIARRERAVTDSEVFQEILHRYVAIGRRDAIQPAFECLLEITDEVFPVRLEEAVRARDLVFAFPRLSARDALHVSVMETHGVTRILSFDRGFDQVSGISRMSA